MFSKYQVDNKLLTKIGGLFFTPLIYVSFLFILVCSVKGIQGNPSATSLADKKWTSGGPFELSPERGRFALLYSVIEDKSLIFSLPVARFAAPDVGYVNGHYVSLFAPLVSFTVAPGYLLGKYFGIAQVGAYSVIALFAVINTFLIRLIARKLGANDSASNIGALIFAFASPAFAYSVTLYQHHISTFLILLSLYLLLRFKNLWSLSLIWLLFAASIPVDYPNLILMFPIAIYASSRILWAERVNNAFKINFKVLGIFTVITLLIPLAFYVWFSTGSYQKPFQLAGTVQSVEVIDAQGKPGNYKDDSSLIEAIPEGVSAKRSATAFFQTRNLLNGLYLQFLSPDRGVLFFTPIMFFALFGALVLWKKNQTALALIIGVIAANISLYSLWGDPWGGWAFGSRYLIPAYSMCAILIALALTKFRKNVFFLLPFLLVSIYSLAVNTVGALTSNANPPQVEVLALEKQSGIVQKYTYERNFDFIKKSGTKSYIFNTYLSSYLTPFQYYLIIVSVLSTVVALSLFWMLIKKHD